MLLSKQTKRVTKGDNMEFWDTDQEQFPPFIRTWKGNGEYLPEENWIQNYIWARSAMKGKDITNRLKKANIINETYILFSNCIWNYKTGEIIPKSSRDTYKLYTSKKNVTNLSGDARIPWNITEHLTQSEIDSLAPFPKSKVVFTKIYK